MNMTRRRTMTRTLAAMTLIASVSVVGTTMGGASPKQAAPAPQQPPRFASTDVSADRKLTFRLFAPKSSEVKLSIGDLPGTPGSGVPMQKDDRGVWEATVGPAPAGAYRYNFNVDGVPTLDPRNPATSESVGNSWSLVTVPGSEWMDTKDVPHGAVAAITYQSHALQAVRRMHIYTPPGYEKGHLSYPVFYLLHGAGDSDDAWTTVGRAGFILDNLIAAGKAVPMIVVMPAGHTRAPGGGGASGRTDEFGADFAGDIMPYVEAHYRTRNDRGSRAIAGLSMGGAQTLNASFEHLDAFGYIGVFSSGLFGIVPMGRPGQPAPAASSGPFPWEEQHKATLDNATLKRGLKLFWFGIGKDDFLYATSTASVALFKRHGFEVVNHESAGGHTWLNWRDYLIEFAPMLFRAK
jgi:enterochelin esterase-like enzyme